MVQVLEPPGRRNFATSFGASGAALRGERPAGICRFALSRNAAGQWSIEGGLPGSPPSFDDLASALAFARREVDAAEAMIELRVDGLYVCVHQPRGWPQRICGMRIAG